MLEELTINIYDKYNVHISFANIKRRWAVHKTLSTTVFIWQFCFRNGIKMILRISTL